MTGRVAAPRRRRQDRLARAPAQGGRPRRLHLLLPVRPLLRVPPRSPPPAPTRSAARRARASSRTGTARSPSTTTSGRAAPSSACPTPSPTSSVAPVNCALSQVLFGLTRAGLAFGDSVVIQGAGGLGIQAAAVAKDMGAGTVIVVDQIPGRLELARAFGADHTINLKEVPDRRERVKLVRQWTGGRGADVACDFVGFPPVIPEGIEMLRSGGTYLEIGTISRGAKIELEPSLARLGLQEDRRRDPVRPVGDPARARLPRRATASAGRSTGSSPTRIPSSRSTRPSRPPSGTTARRHDRSPAPRWRRSVPSPPAALPMTARLVPIGLITFVFNLGGGLVAPALPLYARSLGADYRDLGLIGASHGLAFALLTIPLGRASDRFGRRAILLLSTIGVGASAALYLVAGHVAGLAAGKLLEAAAWAAFWPTLEAWVAERFGTRAGAAMGVAYGAYAAAFVVGSSLGGFVIEAFGLRAPFVLYLATSALTVLLVRRSAAGGRGPGGAPRRGGDAPDRDHRPRLGPEPARPRLCHRLRLRLRPRHHPRVPAAYGADRALSPRGVGPLLGTYWIARVVGSLGAGRVSDALGRRLVLVPAMLAMAGGAGSCGARWLLGPLPRRGGARRRRRRLGARPASASSRIMRAPRSGAPRWAFRGGVRCLDLGVGARGRLRRRSAGRRGAVRDRRGPRARMVGRPRPGAPRPRPPLIRTRSVARRLSA